jgi:predicted kinase
MAMDLDRAGRYDLSRAFVEAWREVTRDRGAPALLDLYRVHLACVRGKVESVRLDSDQFSSEQKAEAARRARTYFNLAYYYVQRRKPPILLLSTGLIGAGKSTLARFTGGDAGFAVFSSDVVRKRLAGVASSARSYTAFESGLYTPEFSRRTYEELFDQARPLLLEGHSVILDATFSRRWQREMAATLAREAGAEFWVVQCVAGERDVLERLRRRQERGLGVSDGRWEIYARERDSFEPMDEVPRDRLLVVHTSGRPATESVRFVLGRLGID